MRLRGVIWEEDGEDPPGVGEEFHKSEIWYELGLLLERGSGKGERSMLRRGKLVGLAVRVGVKAN